MTKNDDGKLITDIAKLIAHEVRASILIGMAAANYRTTYRHALKLAMRRETLSEGAALAFAHSAAKQCHEASVKLSEEASDRQWATVAKVKAALGMLDDLA